MKHLGVLEFDTLPFKEKISYLYSALKEPYTSSDLTTTYTRQIVERGCEYFLKNMERRMDEQADDYRYEFGILGQEEFEEQFGRIDGVCTKDLNVFLNETVLRDPEVYGGATLFHERITKRIKSEVGQLVPILEECLVNRTLLISLGAYEEYNPSIIYGVLKEILGEDLDKIFLGYESGEKFKEVFRLITTQDEKEKTKIIPSFVY